MFDNLKKILYFSKLDLLGQKGLKDGSLLPFDEAFYEKMSHTYIGCIPVSMYIKYLGPRLYEEYIGALPGKCNDRSLYMFFCFDEALLVRGDSKDLEYIYGKEDGSPGHGWIEIGNYVYEPELLLKFKKDIFYKMYCPVNVHKYTKEDYIRENKEFYEEITSTTLKDFQPGGRKRIKLGLEIPLLEKIANNSNNFEFKKELCNYLDSIQYDEKQVFEEMNEAFQKSFKEETRKI